MDIKEVLLQQFIDFLIIKTSGSGIKTENMSDLQLAEQLHEPIIRKFNKRKVQSPFIDNVWGADLADTQLISKFNKGIRFLLCVIDIFNKYAWILPLKDKRGITITNAFKKFYKNLISKQTRYGQIKAVNFTTDQ